MATRKDKAFRLQRQVERNARLSAKDVERRDRIYPASEVNSRMLHVRLAVEKKLIEVEKDMILKSMFNLHMLDIHQGSNWVSMPRNFSLCNNYVETMRAIKVVASSIFNFADSPQVHISFENTASADTGALFLMRVVYLELMEKFQALQNKLTFQRVLPNIKFFPARNRDVNRLLVSTGYLLPEDLPVNQIGNTTLAAVNDIGYLKGLKARSHIHDNRKGPHATTIADYVDNCLQRHDFEFSLRFKNQFEQIIAEVLSNAEDHTNYPAWYITANFSQDDFGGGPDYVTGEINLTILNFGNSMYEGFLETKDENYRMFNNVENFVNDLFARHTEMKSYLSAEQVFTMALLQDQISRLKFNDESRGTGTMKFISAFLEIGDYHNRERGYVPNLSIISGHTHISCDHTCQPLVDRNLFGIALNKERDLKMPPDKNHLKELKEKFPGTLFSVKMYLNKSHLLKKITNKS